MLIAPGDQAVLEKMIEAPMMAFSDLHCVTVK
jgi:hypothetical protein